VISTGRKRQDDLASIRQSRVIIIIRCFLKYPSIRTPQPRVVFQVSENLPSVFTNMPSTGPPAGRSFRTRCGHLCRWQSRNCTDTNSTRENPEILLRTRDAY